MIYQFRDTETDERVFIEFSPDDAPRIGDLITHRGRQVRRVLGTQTTCRREYSGKYPITSRSLPLCLSGVTKDERGRAVIRNEREHREIMDRLGLEQE